MNPGGVARENLLSKQQEMPLTRQWRTRLLLLQLFCKQSCPLLPLLKPLPLPRRLLPTRQMLWLLPKPLPLLLPLR